MSRYTLKSSTVFVSIGEETRVFRSVDEVPAEWIRHFERSKGRLRPQTILIADPKGREEILRGLQGLPSSVRPRWNPATIRPGAANAPAGGAQTRRIHWTRREILAEVSLAAIIGAGIALAFFWNS
jgi:hypothetical protein